MKYKYIWIIIRDRTRLYLDWIWAWLATERGSGCNCPACIDWGPSVAMDSSQVTDLLSWAHTCLWGQEDLLLSYHGFRLSEPTIMGGLLGGGLSTALRPGLRCWGLGVSVWTGTWTPWQEWNRLVLFVPVVQMRRVFRGTQLGYIDLRIAIFGTVWLGYGLAP
jgi:hypothetical protein